MQGIIHRQADSYVEAYGFNKIVVSSFELVIRHFLTTLYKNPPGLTACGVLY
jgi:hypothetical protein